MIFEAHIAAFDPSKARQLVGQREYQVPLLVILLRRSKLNADNPNSLGALSMESARPCSGCADQRNELPPPHSITSSARAMSEDGMVRPSAFAVFRLITS